ncbi:SIMPL domain-containing protein [Gracilibacillus oryzae]|nr:SIMPL domain-containing protein [Gracilibacillus oryzae]
MHPIHSSNIVVYGTGIVTAIPDQATVQLGVVTEGKSAQAVQQENNNRMTQVYQALLAYGIPQERIQTIEVSIIPQYEYIDGNQQLIGYQATNRISVQIDNVDHIGNIIDIAVTNGANQISDIQFQVADENQYYQKALQAALYNGSQKASTISHTLSRNISLQPVSIKEIPADSPALYKTYQSSFSANAAVPVSPGQLEIEAKVKMIYCFT